MALDVLALRTSLIDHALGTGRFLAVSGHEPRSAPQTGLTAATWLQELRPVPRASGLAATSALVRFWLRVYSDAIGEPQDDIDPRVADAVGVLMAAYTANFTLGGQAMNVDLLGIHGTPLSARAGYLTIAQTQYRVMTIDIPIIVADVWPQSP